MNLIEYLDLFAGALINFMFCVIIIKKIFVINVIKEKCVVIALLIGVSIVLCLINIYNKDVFKILITIPFVTLGVKEIYKLSFRQSFLYALAAILYMFLGEILVSIILSVSSLSYEIFSKIILGRLVGAIAVTIFTLPFIIFKPIRSILIAIIKKISDKNVILFGVVFLCAVGAFGYKNLLGIEGEINLIINISIFFIFLIIIYLFYMETEKTKAFSQEYSTLLDYLDKYEIELDEKRKLVHDFKNQLIVINGYADESNIKLKEYISEIINDQKKTVQPLSLIKGVENLPKGIKGLIYYKLSQLDKTYMVEINVKNKLDIFNNLNQKTSKETLKIIGILIDNAIEAVSNLKSKFINLNFTANNTNIIVEIRNNFSEEIDIDKVMLSGYSTKGNNRGYGLALVQDIIKNNNNFSFNLKSDGNVVNAIIKIKII